MPADPASLLAQFRSGSKAQAERAARNLKHLAQTHPAALYPFRQQLIDQALNNSHLSPTTNPDVRVRWNLIVILGLLLPFAGRKGTDAQQIDAQQADAQQSDAERTDAQQADAQQQAAVTDWMLERLRDPSPLSRTFALQALFNVSAADPTLRRRLLPIAQRLADSDSAAVRARARKLLGRPPA